MGRLVQPGARCKQSALECSARHSGGTRLCAALTKHNSLEQKLSGPRRRCCYTSCWPGEPQWRGTASAGACSTVRAGSGPRAAAGAHMISSTSSSGSTSRPRFSASCSAASSFVCMVGRSSAGAVANVARKSLRAAAGTLQLRAAPRQPRAKALGGAALELQTLRCGAVRRLQTMIRAAATLCPAQEMCTL